MANEDSRKKPEFTNTNTGSASIPQAGEKTTILSGMNSSSGLRRLLPILNLTTGPEQGRILSLMESGRIEAGRSKNVELSLMDPSCSRRHSEIYWDPVAEKAFVKDLGSTNGTRVNGARIKTDTQLADGDRIQLGDNTIVKFLMLPEEEAHAQMNIYIRATRDALTNALNKRQFEEALGRELAFQSRGGTALGLLIFDVDFFKKINDGFGHITGDEVLREIGRRVPNVVRKEDLFARIGGEEFAILTRNEDEAGLMTFAERLRVAMGSTPAEFEGRKVTFTVSVGACFLKGKTGVLPDAFMQKADEALYSAKNSGRNKCVLVTL